MSVNGCIAPSAATFQDSLKVLPLMLYAFRQGVRATTSALESRAVLAF